MSHNNDIVYNILFGASPDIVAECIFKACSELLTTRVNVDTGKRYWIPPNKDTWERFRIVTPNTTTISTRTEDMLPMEMKKPGVFYKTNDLQHSGVGYIDEDSVMVSFFHFGGKRVVPDMIVDSMIELGIPESSIGRTEGTNDIKLNGKKMAGSVIFFRDGYMLDQVVYFNYYNHKKWTELIPEQYNLRIDSPKSQGMTGILNEFPDFPINRLYTCIAAKRNIRAPEWVDCIGSNLDIVNGHGQDVIIEEGLRSLEKNKREKLTLLESMYKESKEMIYSKIRRHRDQLELDIIPKLTDDEYKEELLKMEYLYRYVEYKRKIINDTTDLVNMFFILFDFKDFEKYYNYQKYVDSKK